MTTANLDIYEDVVQQGMNGNVQPFIETLFRIQNKSGQMVPLHLKPAQQEYNDKCTQADIILKAAQMGFTTWIIAEFTAYALLMPGVECLITAQRDDSGTRLFDIAHRFIRSMPPEIQPRLLQSSKHIIEIDHSDTTPGMSSIIEVGSAASKTFGRGRPTHFGLFTEVGFYDEDAVKMIMGIISRMPVGKSRYVLESTADGQNGYFFEQWNQATNNEGELTAHFFPWWKDPEYAIARDPSTRWGKDVEELDEEERRLITQYHVSHDQIRWRRFMMARMLNQHESADFFKQEFPESPDEAFLPIGSSIFRAAHISSASLTVRDPFDDDGLNSRWVDPLAERAYIVSIDQASGETRDIDARPTDFQVLTVWDSVQMEQVHRVRNQEMTHRAMARHAVKQAREYNDALICMERNLARYGLIEMIQEEGYFNIYVHEDGKYGYPVSVSTKPVLKDQVIEMLKSRGSLTIHSENLIRELRNYRNLPKVGRGSMGAGPGGHDDELITLFFACDPNVRAQAFASRRQGTGETNTQHTTRFLEVI